MDCSICTAISFIFERNEHQGQWINTFWYHVCSKFDFGTHLSVLILTTIWIGERSGGSGHFLFSRYHHPEFGWWNLGKSGTPAQWAWPILGTQFEIDCDADRLNCQVQMNGKTLRWCITVKREYHYLSFRATRQPRSQFRRRTLNVRGTVKFRSNRACKSMESRLKADWVWS